MPSDQVALDPRRCPSRGVAAISIHSFTRSLVHGLRTCVASGARRGGSPAARAQYRVAATAALLACALASTPLQAPAEEQALGLDGPGAVALRWGPARCWSESEDGLQSLRCLSQGNGEPFFAATARPLAEPLDLRGRFVKLWIRVEELRHLGAFELRLSSDDFQSGYYAFSVPLFGDLEFNVLQDATWAVYTFSFASARVEGAPDRARIDSLGWLMRDAGHGAVDVSVAGGASVVSPKRGAVSITFDDGVADQWEAAEILGEHGFGATAYVIPDLIGRPGYLELSQLRSLRDRFGWQIAGHHGIPLTHMTPRQLERAIFGVRRYLMLNGFDSGASHFAYPLGKIDARNVLRVSRQAFSTARMAGSGLETLPPADPHKLRVMNVLHTTRPEDIVARARAAVENGDWLILMFHKLRSPATDALEYEPARLRALAQQLAQAGIQPETVDRVWARLPR